MLASSLSKWMQARARAAGGGICPAGTARRSRHEAGMRLCGRAWAGRHAESTESMQHLGRNVAVALPVLLLTAALAPRTGWVPHKRIHPLSGS